MSLNSTLVLVIAIAVPTIPLLLALYFLVRNAPNYTALRSALAATQLRLPEEKLGYGANYLNRFMQAAQVAAVGNGASAIKHYIDPTLGLDQRFAIALAAALVLGNLAIWPFMPLEPFGGRLALFCAFMSAMYGLSDVLEDSTLKRVLSAGPPVDRNLAKQASGWTLLKFATIFLTLPALLGFFTKFFHDRHYDAFYGALKFWPLGAFLWACFQPRVARVLWACRVSVVSALAGYYLFLSVIQAQDLFADDTYGGQGWWNVGFWVCAFLALAFVWALPVHYAARAAVEGENAAWYVRELESSRLVRWTPRILGMIPVVAVLLGIFGAAVETRYAWHLERGLPEQFVLLSLGGWLTLGFVLAIMVKRRNFVERFLSSRKQSQAVVVLCGVATSIVFLFLMSAPLVTTQRIDRAALAPIVLGSGVLLFGWLGRWSDRARKPILGLFLAMLVGLTALNTRFNDIRPIPSKAPPARMSLGRAAEAWMAANSCKGKPEACPPALIVAADGGASRAGYFSAAVVGALLDRLKAPAEGDPAHSLCVDAKNPARCIFAFSGVSGGSLGLTAVKAALLDAGDSATSEPPCAVSKGWQDCLSQLVAGDYLSPAFVGLAFRDQFAPPVFFFTNPDRWGDRAVLLEKAAERAYRSKISGNPHEAECDVGTIDKGLCRPFAAPAPGGRWAPLLLLNGTSVQRGRRIIASEIEPLYEDKNGARQALHAWAYDLFDVFRCPPGEPDQQGDCKPGSSAPPIANVRLSTAAFLSARFPIISPAAHAHTGSGRGDEIVDGGYFENSGLSTALDVAAGLRALDLTPIVLSISNGPTLEKVEKVKNEGSAPEVACDAVTLDVHPAASDSIVIRAVEIAYAPLAGLFHTRDGHGDEATLTLKRRLAEWNAHSHDPCDARYASFFPVGVYATGDTFTMPDLSMSWWLSPVVQKALDHQLDHPANRKQFDRLVKRLADTGCQDCDVGTR